MPRRTPDQHIADLQLRVAATERRLSTLETTPRIRALVEEHKFDLAQREEESKARSAEHERDDAERASIREALRCDPFVLVSCADTMIAHRGVQESKGCDAIGLGPLVTETWAGHESEWRELLRRHRDLAELTRRGDIVVGHPALAIQVRLLRARNRRG